MMRIQQWIVAIARTLVTVLLGGLVACTPVSTVPTPVPSTPVMPSPTISTTPIPQSRRPLPNISQDRLQQHLQALDFERQTDGDRDRARQYLIQQLQAVGWIVTEQAFPGGVNLIATLTDRPTATEVILLTAHYDTVSGSVGADDNASAIAAVLEIARSLGDRPTARQLKIAFFDQEEQGLKGSLTFTGIPENLEHLQGVVNLEMIGYTCQTIGCQRYPDGLPIEQRRDRGDFLAVVGDQEHPELIHAFQAETADDPSVLASSPLNLPVLTVRVPLKGILTPDLLRSDHAPFWVRNIGAVMITDTAHFRNPTYHTSQDTYETLDLLFLTRSTTRVLEGIDQLLRGTNAVSNFVSNTAL